MHWEPFSRYILVSELLFWSMMRHISHLRFWLITLARSWHNLSSFSCNNSSSSDSEEEVAVRSMTSYGSGCIFISSSLEEVNVQPRLLFFSWLPNATSQCLSSLTLSWHWYLGLDVDHRGVARLPTVLSSDGVFGHPCPFESLCDCLFLWDTPLILSVAKSLCRPLVNASNRIGGAGFHFFS